MNSRETPRRLRRHRCLGSLRYPENSERDERHDDRQGYNDRRDNPTGHKLDLLHPLAGALCLSVGYAKESNRCSKRSPELRLSQGVVMLVLNAEFYVVAEGVPMCHRWRCQIARSLRSIDDRPSRIARSSQRLKAVSPEPTSSVRASKPTQKGRHSARKSALSTSKGQSKTSKKLR